MNNYQSIGTDRLRLLDVNSEDVPATEPRSHEATKGGALLESSGTPAVGGRVVAVGIDGRPVRWNTPSFGHKRDPRAMAELFQESHPQPNRQSTRVTPLAGDNRKLEETPRWYWVVGALALLVAGTVAACIGSL